MAKMVPCLRGVSVSGSFAPPFRTGLKGTRGKQLPELYRNLKSRKSCRSYGWSGPGGIRRLVTGSIICLPGVIERKWVHLDGRPFRFVSPKPDVRRAFIFSFLGGLGILESTLYFLQGAGD